MVTRNQKNKNQVKEGLKLQGFFRVQIWDAKGENPRYRLASDSGWMKNQKTNIGFLNYINYVFGASAGSLLVTHGAVGTGGTPASSAGSLAGESTLTGVKRAAVTYSAPSSTQAQWTFSWNSSSAGTSFTIGNVGLYGHSSTNSLFCGISTTGQTWGVSQTCACTYQLNLS